MKGPGAVIAMLTQASYESTQTSGGLNPSPTDIRVLDPGFEVLIQEDDLARAFGLLTTGERDEEGVHLFDPIVERDGKIYEPWPAFGYGTHAVSKRYPPPRGSKSVSHRPIRPRSAGVRKAFTDSRAILGLTTKPGSQTRDGGKHYKDVARREFTSHKVKRRKPGKMIFDSTLGYPGEGHAARVDRHHAQRCYNCRQVGHLAAACPQPHRPPQGQGRGERRPRMADDAPDVPLRDLHGRPAAEAAFMVDVNQGRVQMGRLGAAAEAVAVRERKTPQQVREETRAEMLAYAEVAFLTKDLSSVADRRVVIRSIGSIAKRQPLDLEGVTTSSFVLGVIADAMDRARTARTNLGLRQHQSKRMWANDVMHAGFNLEPLPSLPKDPITAIEVLESARPWTSVFAVPGSYWAYYVPLILRVLVVSVFEEYVKYLIPTILFTVTFADLLQHVGMLKMFCDLEISDPRFRTKNAPMMGEYHFYSHQWKYCLNIDSLEFYELFYRLLISFIVPVFFAQIEYKRWGHSFYTRLFGHFIIPFLGSYVHGSMVPIGLACILHFSWNYFAFVFWGKPCMLDSFSVDRLNSLYVRPALCLFSLPIKPIKLSITYAERDRPSKCEPHFGGRRFFGVEGYVASFHNPCSHNEQISMEGRVGKACPVHDDLINVRKRWERTIRQESDFICDQIERVRRPYPYEQWAGTFPPKKRDQLLKLREESFRLPKKLIASSFLKWEPTMRLEAEIGLVVEKDPRFIQGCPVELTATCGPYVRRLAKNVREGLRPRDFDPSEILAGKQIIYTCGLSLEKIGEVFAAAISCIMQMCDSGEYVSYLEDDQSRFDLHLTEGPFKFLNSLYRRKLSMRVAKALKRGISKGRSSLGTRYQVNYTMQSGWPDTSVGDTLVNVAMKYSIHGRGRKWISIICGDDSVTITTNRELDLLGGVKGIQNMYSVFGMEVEAKVATNPLDVEFCSARFVPVGEGYVLVPKLGKLLARLGWDGVDRPKLKQLEWLRGICNTLSQFGKLDPLLGRFAGVLRQACGSGVALTSRSEYVLFSDGSVEVSMDDYLYHLNHRYSLAEADFQCMLKCIDEWKFGDVFTHPYFLHVASLDS